MKDHLTVLGYLVTYRHIRGFSIVEHPPTDEFPFEASVLLYGDEDELMLAFGDTMDEALAGAVAMLLDGPGDLDFDLPDGVLHA